MATGPVTEPLTGEVIVTLGAMISPTGGSMTVIVILRPAPVALFVFPYGVAFMVCVPTVGVQEL